MSHSDNEKRNDDPFAPAAPGKTLLWERGGRRYQTWRDENPDLVAFCTQGGGWVQKMPKDEFLRDFRRLEVDPAVNFPAFVESDFIEGRLPCHANGMAWNGWGMPEFEFETAIKLTEMMPELIYHEPSDSFVWIPNDDPEETERYGSRVTLSEDRLVKTYPIGSGSWTWEACEKATPDERLERAAMDGDDSRVVLAVSEGADPNALNRDGVLVREAARKAGHAACADILDSLSGLADKKTAKSDLAAGRGR